VALPAGNFIVMADLPGSISLAGLASGLGLPDTAVTGRVQVNVRDGKVTASVAGKEILPAQVRPAGDGVLHLEAGKFGHVLLFRPVKS
jgi:hypothetical protein